MGKAAIATGPGRMALRRYPGGVRMPLHAHEFSKISILLSGSVLEEHGREERLCRAGDIVIKPSGVEHGDWIGPEGLCVLSIRVEDAVAPAYEHVNGLMQSYRWLPIDPIVSRIVRSHLRGDTLDSDVMEECFVALGSRRAEQERHAADARHWAHRAIRILRDTFREPPSLSDLASEVGVHPVSLAQALRRRYGMSKTEIVQQIRIQYALTEIQRTTSIAKLAHQAGFFDQPHLCRTFRQWVGCSPQEYRLRFCGKG